MRIGLSSVMVDDQEKALQFYTGVLGFEKRADIPFGDDRWLTVVSPEGDQHFELVLEPMRFSPARVYQKALYDAGIPLTAFFSSNIHEEYQRLKARGVIFRGEPADMGAIWSVIFEDTCGNLINLVEPVMQPDA
jgi:catechol 2,3-dioxygenase-like lactoylglutathione lyase family enzyme